MDPRTTTTVFCSSSSHIYTFVLSTDAMFEMIRSRQQHYSRLKNVKTYPNDQPISTTYILEAPAYSFWHGAVGFTHPINQWWKGKRCPLELPVYKESGATGTSYQVVSPEFICTIKTPGSGLQSSTLSIYSQQDSSPRNPIIQILSSHRVISKIPNRFRTRDFILSTEYVLGIYDKLISNLQPPVIILSCCIPSN